MILMYIKEDLVYNKHTNALVGFTNLSNINNHLLTFQRSSLDDTSNGGSDQLLAKTMTVMMVQGLFSNLEFPYVQFPCNKMTGDLLFQPFWEAVRRIEFLGLKVIAVTADGASTNWHLIILCHTRLKIHMPLKNVTSTSALMCHIY